MRIIRRKEDILVELEDGRLFCIHSGVGMSFVTCIRLLTSKPLMVGHHEDREQLLVRFQLNLLNEGMEDE